LEDIPVIPDLEDVQEEDMMTQIAAPPRCVIDMLHLEPFSISGLLCEKNSSTGINLCPVVGSIHATLEEFQNGSFTLKTHQMFSVMPSFSKSSIFKMFNFQSTRTLTASDFKFLRFNLKSVLEKLRFHDGLV